MNLPDLAVEKLAEYVRIPTFQPKPEYDKAVEFFSRYATEIGSLQFKTEKLVSGHPFVLMSWIGSNPSLPSILLNSHMDVVPVVVENWKIGDPLGFRQVDNKLYGRGTQDMKSICIQQLEAIRHMIHGGYRLKHTVHILAVPDEEVGGEKGMKELCEHENLLDSLNIGLALDEGVPSPANELYLFTSERYPMSFELTIEGPSGHGSLPCRPEFCTEKFRAIFNQLSAYHETEMKDLGEPPSLINIGKAVCINLTSVEAGAQTNIIPSSLKAVFDCRVPPDRSKEFKERVMSIVNEVDSSIKIRDMMPVIKSNANDDATVRMADSISYILSQMPESRQCCKVGIMPGTTDMRYLRGKGVCSIGFSPLNWTPLLLHADDEYVDRDIFLAGIQIYKQILISLGQRRCTGSSNIWCHLDSFLPGFFILQNPI